MRIDARLMPLCFVFAFASFAQCAFSQATQPSPPVLYSAYESPRQLSADQLAAILKSAAASKPEGREIWFVFVRSNLHPLFGQPHMLVEAFYSPDATTRRLRKGKAVWISTDWPDPSVTDYQQVSRPDHPFGDKLELPAEIDVPMIVKLQKEHKPLPSSDDDIIQLVDFARPILETKHRQGQPILRISGDGGSFDVYMGFHAGMLDGREWILHAKKTADGFTQTGEIGRFVS